MRLQLIGLLAAGFIVVGSACSGHNVGTGQDAGAPDARARDAASDRDADLATLCPLDAQGTASATGHSPLGPFHANLAWFGEYFGECGGMRVFLVPDRETFERILASDGWYEPGEDDNAVELYPQNWDIHSGWINTGPVQVSHYFYGQRIESTGSITITEYIEGTFTPETVPAPVLRAFLTADEPGWSLFGRLDAPQCVDLFIGCP